MTIQKYTSLCKPCLEKNDYLWYYLYFLRNSLGLMPS